MSDIFDVRKICSQDNPRVFLDISVDGGPPERLEIELFSNIVPLTAENFRALCTGEKGIGKTTKLPLHYKGTVLNICNGLLAQGGAFSEDPDCGESIYGGYFKDENFRVHHSEPGMVAMQHHFASYAIGSLFYITFRRSSYMDGLGVVFGKVRKGMSTLCRINELETPPGVVRIVDCGQISQGKKKESLNRASSSDEREKQKKCLSSEGLFQISDWCEISEDKRDNIMEADQGTKKKSLNRASSFDGVIEYSDEEEKQKKSSSSEGLLQISDRGEIDQGKKIKSLKRASSFAGHSDEREKQRKYLSSEGLIHITDRGRFSEDKDKGFQREHPRKQVGDYSLMKLWQQIEWVMAAHLEHAGDYSIMEMKEQIEWVMTSLIEQAGDNSIMEHPRQQVGDDSIMELRELLDWMVATICGIARMRGFQLPSYPLPCAQQGGRGQD